MTLAEMRRNIQFGLGLREPEEQPIIDQKINDGVKDVLRRTGCTVLCFDATTPDNQSRLTLSSQIMRVIHVSRNDVRLNRTTYEQLGRYPSGYATVGDILHFGTAFDPAEKLQIYGVPRPTKLTADADALENPTFGGIKPEFQDAVELYAMAELADLAGDETSQRGGTYRVMYEGQDTRQGRIAEIKREVNKMGGLTLGKARLEYRLVGVR